MSSTRFVEPTVPGVRSAVVLPRGRYGRDAESQVGECITVQVRSGNMSMPYRVRLIRLIGVVDSERARSSHRQFAAGDALYAWERAE